MTRKDRDGEPVEVFPVGWTEWDESRAECIRERILRGDYNAPAVLERVARRLLETGAV